MRRRSPCCGGRRMEETRSRGSRGEYTTSTCERLLAGVQLIDVPARLLPDACCLQPSPSRMRNSGSAATAAVATPPPCPSSVEQPRRTAPAPGWTTTSRRRSRNDSEGVQQCLQPDVAARPADKRRGQSDPVHHDPCQSARVGDVAMMEGTGVCSRTHTPTHHHHRCPHCSSSSVRSPCGSSLSSMRRHSLHASTGCQSCCHGRWRSSSSHGGRRDSASMEAVDATFAVYDKTRYADKPQAKKKNARVGAATTDFWTVRAHGGTPPLTCTADSHNHGDDEDEARNTTTNTVSTSASTAAATMSDITSSEDGSSSALQIPTAAYLWARKMETPKVQDAPAPTPPTNSIPTSFPTRQCCHRHHPRCEPQRCRHSPRAANSCGGHSYDRSNSNSNSNSSCGGSSSRATGEAATSPGRTNRACRGRNADPTPHQCEPGEKAGGDTEEEELRKAFRAACTCYWSLFLDLVMPINPASHAPSCPAHEMQSQYEALMEAAVSRRSSSSDAEDGDAPDKEKQQTKGSPREAGDKEEQASSTQSCSRCGCFGCCCACCGGRGRNSGKENSPCTEKEKTKKDVCSRCLAEQRIRDYRRKTNAAAATLAQSPLQQQQQRTATAVGAARSAVMGTAKRRTAFDVLGEREVAAVKAAKAAAVAASSQTQKREAEEQEEESHDSAVNATTATDGDGEPPQRQAGEAVEEDKAKRRKSSTSPAAACSSFVIPPGPGAYDVVSAYVHTSASPQPRHASIGKALRPTDRKDATASFPGPGAYNVAPPLVPIDGGKGRKESAEGAPHEGAGTAKGEEDEGGERYKPPPQAPVPFYSSSARNLTYGTASPYLKNPQATEREKEGETLVRTSPGPGEYRPEDAYRKEGRMPSPPAFSFPKAAAAAPAMLGSSSSPSSLLLVPVMGGGGSSSPGPATYDARTGREIGAAGSGPAISVPRADSRRALSGKAAAAAASDADAEGNVGPATYAVESAWKYVEGGGYAATFGATSRGLDAGGNGGGGAANGLTVAVGPGDYDGAAAALALQFRSSPRWTIRGLRHSSPPQEQQEGNSAAPLRLALPGPGEYMPIYSTQHPATRGYYIGTAPRLLNQQQTPLDSHDGRVTELGTTTAFERAFSRALAVSGAGWTSQAARVTHTAELAKRSAEAAAPGPGAYAVTYTAVEPRAPQALLTASAPRLSSVFPSSDAADGAGDVPGPGAYEVDAVLAAMERRTGAVIGTAKRRIGLLHSHGGGGSGHYSGQEEVAAAFVGPGTYDLPALDTGRAYTFSREPITGGTALSSAGTRIGLDVPGPGTYNLAEAMDASSAQRRPPRAVLATTGPRFHEAEKAQADYPGPGSYSPQGGGVAGKDAAIFGTAPRQLGEEAEAKKREEYSNIGPGSYETDAAAFSRAAGGFIGLAPRFSGGDEAGGPTALPGPGAYETGAYYAYMAGQQESLGGVGGLARVAPRLTEADAHAQEVPGPGAYLPQLSAVQAGVRGVVLGSAPRTGTGAAQGADSPVGPGTYEVAYHASERSAPGVVFGRAPRLPRIGEEGEGEGSGAGQSVGPGTYSPLDRERVGGGNGPAAVFGTSPRDDDGGAGGRRAGGGGGADVPGPGTYEVYRTRDGQLLWRDVKGAVSFGNPPSSAAQRRGGGKDEDQTPGPGTYQLPYESTQKPSQHGAVFGTGPGHADGDDDDDDGARAVGPGAYDVRDAVSRPQAPAFSFGKAPVATGGTGKGGDTNDDDASPGPGAYLPVAGPCASSVELPSSRAVRFPTASRFPSTSADGDAANDSGRLGPGSYSPSYHLVKERAPVATMGTASRQQHEEEQQQGGGAETGSGLLPGPGSYSVTSPPAAPAMTFSTAPRFPGGDGGERRTGEEGQGVAASDYDVLRAQHAVLPHAPAYSFGKARLLPNGVVAATSGSGDDNAATTPGPGYYQVDNDGTMRLLYRTAPSASFGTSRPSDPGTAKQSDAPGPGDYDTVSATALLPSGPQVVFGTAPTGRATVRANNEETAENAAAPGPGPGSYDVTYPRDGPAFTMAGASSRERGAGRTEEGPGPGSYETLAYRSIGCDGPAISVPRATRFPRHGEEDDRGEEGGWVGPGWYASVGADGGAGRPPSGPAVSFPRAPREGPENKHSMGFPGPGHYSATTTTAATAAATGAVALRYTASRFPEAQQQEADRRRDDGGGGGGGGDVGPGTYSPSMDAASGHNGPSFPLAERFPSSDGARDAGDVGPGSYDIPLALRAISGKGPSPVFGTAPRGLDHAATDGANGDGTRSGQPGPASYSVGGVIGKEGRAHTMPTADRWHDGTTTGEGGKADGGSPGPATYSAASYDSIGQNARAAILLGRHEYPPRGPHAEAVGPGSYDTASAIAATLPGAPAYSMTGRPAMDGAAASRRDVPGPGAYDSAKAMNYVLGTGPAFTLTGREAQRSLREEYSGEGPGPATYSLPEPDRGLAVGFGTTPRMPDGAATDRGGGEAAFYDTRCVTPSGPSYSFGTAARAVSTPSPPSRPSDEAATTTMMWPSSGGGGVGPGAYDTGSYIGQTSALNGSTAISFPRAPRMPLGGDETDGPGPGAYCLPGSGDYTAHFRGRIGPSFGVGGAARDGYITATHSADAPGPGTYDSNPWRAFAESGPAPTFGVGERMRDAAAEAAAASTPGPATYYTPYGGIGSDLSQGVSFGIGARPDPAPPHTRDTPGPGEYHRYSPLAVDARLGPTFGVGNRPSPVMNDYPGPGTYHRQNGSHADGGKAPSFGIGERPSSVANDYPGPGAYFKYEENDGGKAPSFGVGERPSSAANDYPGPVDYYTYYRWGEGADRPTIPKAERFPSCPDSGTPGPATYQPEISAPTATAATRKLEARKQVRFALSPINTIPTGKRSNTTVASKGGTLSEAAAGKEDSATLARLAKAGYPLTKTRAK